MTVNQPNNTMKLIAKSSAFAPATVANLACGFDVLGLAVHTPGDVVEATLHDEIGPVTITDVTGDGGVLPREAHLNTASVAVMALCKSVDFRQAISLVIHKQMPLGSGMGSSAASAVAAIAAVNALLPVPLPKESLVTFVMEAEQIACGAAHADNVAPSLLGGIVLIRSYHPLDVIKLPVPADLAVCIVHPALEVRTETSRAILRKQIALGVAIEQWGNLAGFVSGLYTNDYDLLRRSLVDVVAEPVRSPLIPNFTGIKQSAMDAGALGCSISGSGPAVFAITKGLEYAHKAAAAMVQAFADINVVAQSFVGLVNNEGARVLKIERF